MIQTKEYQEVLKDIFFIIDSRYINNKQRRFNRTLKQLNQINNISGVTTEFFYSIIREHKQEIRERIENEQRKHLSLEGYNKEDIEKMIREGVDYQTSTTTSEKNIIKNLLKNSFLHREQEGLNISIKPNPGIVITQIYNKWYDYEDIDSYLRPIIATKTIRDNIKVSEEILKQYRQYKPMPVKRITEDNSKHIEQDTQNRKALESCKIIDYEDLFITNKAKKTDNYDILLKNINKEFN